ncbi:uncharacterized protein LOC135841841 [Planococcus citri]|uniref:uncharacterized protein LOC135841841 n=1 Tax=Planococcus citri TaxID=170843 RepID=UPI0031F756DD
MPYLRYVPASEGFIPDDALVVGHESDNSKLYGAIAEHNGCIIPGKISSRSNGAIVGCDLQEHLKNDYEILCIDSNLVQWISDSNGKVPSNAIPVGKHLNGETLYMGRAHYEGALIPGKIQSSWRCLFSTHNGQEVAIFDYEVLTFKNPSSSTFEALTTEPTIRNRPARCSPLNCCQLSCKRFKMISNRVLRSSSVLFSCCVSRDIRKIIRLVPASNGFMPDDALVVGHEADHSKLLYGVRAEHNGCIIPGKISPQSNAAVVGRDWHEHLKNDYEVLCADPSDVEWVKGSYGDVPSNAIPVGKHLNGETFYMGRAHYEGALIPGKIERSWACLFITHNGREIRITQYETLTLKNPSSRNIRALATTTLL